MKKLLMLTLVLSACATPTWAPTPVSSQARQSGEYYATAQAAAAQETTVAFRATTVSGEATAVARATATAVSAAATRAYQERADDLAMHATAVAIDATASAFGRLATAEANEIAGRREEMRAQATATAVALHRAQTVNALLPGTLIVLIASGVGFLAFLAWRWYALSQPVRARNGEVMALPAGRYDTPRVWPVRAGEAPALPPPAAEPRQLPPLATGHVLVVGVTGDGKTQALREIIEHRDGRVVVLDPHYTPGAWGAADVISAGGGYGRMLAFLREVDEELAERRRQREAGRRQFDALTVATEEMPAIVSEGGREVVGVWRRIMREGRKFSLYMVVVTQSTRVRALGIEGEGDLLENFRHVLLLGKAAAAEFPDVVAGMERPAVLRSGHGEPLPVVVPYDPRRDPESPQFRPMLPERPAQPQLPAERATPHNVGVMTEDGLVSPAQVRQISDMMSDGASGRAIEQAVWGYVGGAAYRMRAAVVEALERATVG